MDFTVEIVAAPVIDDNWDRLRELLDVVPGTLLIEDPDEPMLIFPVEADSPRLAASFIEGVSSVACLRFVHGQVYPAPDLDFELPEDDQRPESRPGVRHRWEDVEDQDPNSARMVAC